MTKIPTTELGSTRMSIAHISADTLDDLLYDVYAKIQASGTRVGASRGETTEITAAALELTNPLARLSRSEARGKIFSCLGELSWYLAGNDSLEMIHYYLPAYDQEAVDGKVLGAYGPRLFGPGAGAQVRNVLDLLRTRPSSRRAVIQLFDSEDIVRLRGDVPCTCALQFLVRADTLDLIVYMRSNDAVKGLPHDVFCFTMLQELFARSLGHTLGTYSHFVGSLHIYTLDQGKVNQFLSEGFQSTKYPMPAMPEGDPWPAVEHFLRIEAAIRGGTLDPGESHDKLPPYWKHLSKLLEAFNARKVGNQDLVNVIRGELAGTVYTPFLDDHR